MTSSQHEPVTQSAPVESTGCASALDHAAAGCAPLESSSEDTGTADHPLQASDASTGCAAHAAADAKPDKPQPPQTLRAFEHALRHQLGFSQRQAAAIAKSGFKPDVGEQPDDTDIQALMDALTRRGAAFKGN